MNKCNSREQENPKASYRKEMTNLAASLENTSITAGRKRKQVEERKEVRFNESTEIHIVERVEPSPVFPTFRLPSVIKGSMTPKTPDVSPVCKRSKRCSDYPSPFALAAALSNTSTDQDTKFSKLTSEQIDGKILRKPKV
ncbi:hypothetical protein FO519_006434 [Halicephalobus sp. NKZ332]|nr:hypothetical protein FO519_006434 [Halicephalobus sp. NKZ332]